MSSLIKSPPMRLRARAEQGLMAAVALAVAIAGCGARSELWVPLESDSSETDRITVASISLGGWHSCALRTDGTVLCWGRYDNGAAHPEPVAMATQGVVTFLAAGSAGTCAVLEGGILTCWGDAAGAVYGQLEPKALDVGYDEVSLGGGFGCAVRIGGSVRCWGNVDGGQLGTPSPAQPIQWIPGVQIQGIHDAQHVSAGDFSVCALRSAGTVFCWGEGPLGDGTEASSWAPVEVKGLPGRATQIAVGGMHACALIEDGTVVCWGRRQGALGLDPTTFTDTTGLSAAPVPGLSNVTMISSGDRQSCALLGDGTVQCWGTNYIPGQGSKLPEPVVGLGPAIAVASGDFHDCALLADRSVACWGQNDEGQLGDGTETTSMMPVKVIGLE